MANARTVKIHVEKIEHPNEMDERAKRPITVLKGLTKRFRREEKVNWSKYIDRSVDRIWFRYLHVFQYQIMKVCDEKCCPLKNRYSAEECEVGSNTTKSYCYIYVLRDFLWGGTRLFWIQYTVARDVCLQNSITRIFSVPIQQKYLNSLVVKPITNWGK